MKLDKPKKFLILFLIITIVIGLGGFLFSMPILKRILDKKHDILNLEEQITIAEKSIIENILLRETFEEVLKNDTAVQKYFYTEMTETGAVDEINRILSLKNLKTETGVSVSSADLEIISIETDETNEESELLRTELYEKIINGSQDRKILSELRSLLSEETAELEQINVKFSLSLTYDEYLDFLTFIDNFEKSISLKNAVFRGDDLNRGEKEIYSFSLDLYILRGVGSTDGEE